MSELRVGPLDDPDCIRLGPAVAAGAEGVLYRAYVDTADGPLQIALKMLQPGHLGNLSEWIDRWRAQVELLVRVRIPGLVAVRGEFVGALPHLPGQADTSVRSLYLHMDWVEGIPLDRWVRNQADREPEQLLATLVPVAAALDLLHSGAATDGVAVVHRDVKPANILIRPGGDTVLVDVGTLRNTAADTRRSGVVGTPGYIAPEVRAKGAYSPASDRYALGAVAFFLLVHEEPPPEADIDELRRCLADAPLLDGRPDVVDHVAAMLDPDPHARPTSAANWVAQLRSSSLAVLPGDSRIAPRAPSTRTKSRKGGPARSERPSRSRKFVRRVGVMGFLFAVAFSLVLLAARGGQDERSLPPGGAWERSALVSEAEQGLRIVFQRREGEGWRVQLRAPCEPTDDLVRSDEWRAGWGPRAVIPPSWVATPLVVLFEPTGNFEKTEQWRVDGADGDYRQTQVKISGEITADGGRGKLYVARQEYNGQGGYLSEVCSWGPATWEATRQPLPRVEELGRSPFPTKIPPGPSTFPTGIPSSNLMISEDDKSVYTVVELPDRGPLSAGYELQKISMETWLKTFSTDISLRGRVLDTALAGQHVWVVVEGVRTGEGFRYDPSDCEIHKIDLHGRSVSKIPVCATHLTPGDGGLWVVETRSEPSGDSGRFNLLRIDPHTEEIRRILSVPLPPINYVISMGSVWVSTSEEGLMRVNPVNGEVLARFPDVKAQNMQGKEDGPLWVLDDQDRFWRIDGQDNARLLVPVRAITQEPEGYPVSAWPGRLFIANSSGVWIGSGWGAERTFYYLDEAGNLAHTAEIPKLGWLIATDEHLWVVSDTIIRVTP